MFAGEVPEPLAFRVRPRADEAFDSWMDRLTARHEVTRAELFRHLGCDPRLAARDLARGSTGMARDDWFALSFLVGRLAWAVGTSEKAIEATFVPAPEAALLPPAARIFACPACWQESLSAGEPLTITRDWILRASWLCLRHHLPLAPIRRLVVDRGPRAVARILEAHVKAIQSLRGRLPPTAVMFEFNRSSINQLLGKRDGGMRRGESGYHVRFLTNRFHLSRARIALLAAAHSERTASANRFEAFVSLTAPGLLRSGKNLLNPKTRRQDEPKSQPVPEGLVTIRINRWQATQHDLVDAYVLVNGRRARSE